ncbi:MAG: hypothetical protein ACOYIS_01120 [Candidatus Cloacimonadaceae bacterium]|jgi:glycosyltransferase involved in cell wall biosynthesis
MRADKRILMIVNEFPPTGESGVQRPLKFLKYLAAAGWLCHVVTPKQLPKSVQDGSLCAEVPASAVIHKTPSWGFRGKAVDQVARIRFQGGQSALKAVLFRFLLAINHLIFPLDKQIGWVPFAFIYSYWLIKKHKIRNVYITAFPFSAFLVGIMLKKCFKDRIFWVADYRDAWQFEPIFEEATPHFRQNIIRYWDKRVLRHCDRAVFVTPGTLKTYTERFRWLKNKASCITNGYDEADFLDLEPNPASADSIYYMGKLYDLQRRSILPLLQVMKDMELQLPLMHVGTINEGAQAAIAKGGYDFYSYHGYVSHQEAIELALGAKINLLLINDDKQSEDVYSGKVFELLRAQRPILALGPARGVVKDLIEVTHSGEYAHLNDSEQITAALRKLLANPENYGSDLAAIQQYERQHLTNKLAKLYERI